MSTGSILIAAALALIVGAYVARPLRASGREGNLDRTIEAWVARVREEKSDTMEYCSQCGRRLGPDDHFCPGCGVRIDGD